MTTPSDALLQVALIPYVCGAGAQTPGCEQGPLDFELRGLSDALQASGRDVWWSVDPEALLAGPYGSSAHRDLPPLGSDERNEIVVWHVRGLADRVEEDVRNGAFVVTLGGDHSMAAGSITGLARGLKKTMGADVRLGLLWLDAHADLNTLATTPSKALHGMPLSQVLGLDVAHDPFGLGRDAVVVAPSHLLYAGLRDLDPGEVDFIRDMNIHSFPMRDLVGKDLASTLIAAMAAMDVDVWAISLDLDGLDPAFAPAVGTPVAGGLNHSDVLQALRAIMGRFDVRLFELAEHNPTLKGAGVNYQTALSTLQVVLDGATQRFKIRSDAA